MSFKSGRKVVDRIKNGIYTYQNEMICCGKERCRKCSAGIYHGPYWYKYWNIQIEDPANPGHTKLKKVQKYVGKELKIK